MIIRLEILDDDGKSVLRAVWPAPFAARSAEGVDLLNDTEARHEGISQITESIDAACLVKQVKAKAEAETA